MIRQVASFALIALSTIIAPHSASADEGRMQSLVLCHFEPTTMSPKEALEKLRHPNFMILIDGSVSQLEKKKEAPLKVIETIDLNDITDGSVFSTVEYTPNETLSIRTSVENGSIWNISLLKYVDIFYRAALGNVPKSRTPLSYGFCGLMEGPDVAAELRKISPNPRKPK